MTVRNQFADSLKGIPLLDGVRLAAGQLNGISVVHKFGANVAVGTSYVPIARGGVYQTPQAASATTLRIKAGGEANDTAAGSGAREVTLIGIDETGAEVTEALATNGASASSTTTATFMRLYRAYVSASGTYGTQSAGSHAGDIVIENGAGGTDWLTIDSTDFPKGQSEVAAYTIPAGKTGYITELIITTDAAKSTDLVLFTRENILQAAAPYDAMRIKQEFIGVAGVYTINHEAPLGPYLENTDIGFLGKVSVGTGAVEINFEIVLVDNNG